MTGKTKQTAHFEPGRGYTQEDWDEVSDNPEWTAEDFREAKPFAEMFPELARSLADGDTVVGDPKLTKLVALDRRVVEKFESQGGDWRERMNEVLRKAVGL
jgi:uncharacterized protein (DUF4415 family)